MNLVKISKIQMYFWFSVTGITLVMVLILFFQDMVESWYFMIPLICFALGLLRRWQYHRLLKSSAERDEREGKKNKKS